MEVMVHTVVVQLQWGITTNNAWEDPAIPNFQQVSFFD